jgi:hypothetical protein
VASRKASKTPSRAALLRNIGFVVAVLLGGVGVWLIVTGGNSTQRIEIGVLTGLWGLLLGAICGRRLVLAEAPPKPLSSESTELAVPDSTEVERVATAAAQRAFAAELQEMLRREFAAAVDDAVAREVSELRAEIAGLRQELLDKVGGQLRLERIETTRLIGSDLEAMRAEVRRLKQVSADGVVEAELDLGDETEMLRAAPVRPALGPETERIPRVPAEPEPKPEPKPEPAPEVEPAPGAAPEPPPAAAAPDPFAGLPRLTPFTDFALDPADRPGTHERSDPADEPSTDAEGSTRRSARHRRRRSDDPAGEELLAQLLAREGARH